MECLSVVSEGQRVLLRKYPFVGCVCIYCESIRKGKIRKARVFDAFDISADGYPVIPMDA